MNLLKLHTMAQLRQSVQGTPVDQRSRQVPSSQALTHGLNASLGFDRSRITKVGL